MPAGLGATANWLLQNQPFQSVNPFGPAGITGATRQGWLTGLQGLGSQYLPAQQYADAMGGMQRFANTAFLDALSSGQFTSNPFMQQAAGMAGGMAGHPGFGMGADWMMRAGEQPGFGAAESGILGTLANYGGGWSGELGDEINRTGASFDPYFNPALGEAVSEANRRLARDFGQTTMPELNRAAVSAGPGAYGGTRAGVAQGIREQGLADAMQRQTTDMLSRGYEAGLGRYVQDRGTTVNAVLDALRQGGQLGLQGSQILGNLAAQQGQLGLGVGRGLGGLAGTQGGLAGQGAGILSGLGLGGLGQQNQMFRFGFGQLLPGMLQNAYQAQLAPGDIQQRMGRQMVGMGALQQQQNQRVLDWMNSQAAQRQQWPWQQFQRYQQAIAPITAPSGSTVSVSGPGPNPWAQGIQGAMLGAGLGNMWSQYQGQGGGYDPRLDTGAGTYY